MNAKEKKAIYDKNRREKIKPLIAEKSKIYREKNREKLNSYAREFYDGNKGSESQRKREYYLKNKELVLSRCKKYREDNPKEKTGKLGTGNYNITLAERNKEEWLNEFLYLYRLKITDEDGTVFYKVGLAKNMRNRLYHIPYEVDVIEAVRMSKYDAVYAEREILEKKEMYKPIKKFGGHTECFLEN